VKDDWKIEERETSVPMWPGSFRRWFCVVNPHGGVMAFMPSEDSATIAMEHNRATWNCACGECGYEEVKP